MVTNLVSEMSIDCFDENEIDTIENNNNKKNKTIASSASLTSTPKKKKMGSKTKPNKKSASGSTNKSKIKSPATNVSAKKNSKGIKAWATSTSNNNTSAATKVSPFQSTSNKKGSANGGATLLSYFQASRSPVSKSAKSQASDDIVDLSTSTPGKTLNNSKSCKNELSGKKTPKSSTKKKKKDIEKKQMSLQKRSLTSPVLSSLTNNNEPKSSHKKVSTKEKQKVVSSSQTNNEDATVNTRPQSEPQAKNDNEVEMIIPRYKLRAKSETPKYTEVLEVDSDNEVQKVTPKLKSKSSGRKKRASASSVDNSSRKNTKQNEKQIITPLKLFPNSLEAEQEEAGNGASSHQTDQENAKMVADQKAAEYFLKRKMEQKENRKKQLAQQQKQPPKNIASIFQKKRSGSNNNKTEQPPSKIQRTVSSSENSSHISIVSSSSNSSREDRGGGGKRTANTTTAAMFHKKAKLNSLMTEKKIDLLKILKTDPSKIEGAPLFPYPSHVFAGSSNSGSDSTIPTPLDVCIPSSICHSMCSEGALKNIMLCLRKTLRYPSSCESLYYYNNSYDLTNQEQSGDTTVCIDIDSKMPLSSPPDPSSSSSALTASKCAIPTNNILDSLFSKAFFIPLNSHDSSDSPSRGSLYTSIYNKIGEHSPSLLMQSSAGINLMEFLKSYSKSKVSNELIDCIDLQENSALSFDSFDSNIYNNDDELDDDFLDEDDSFYEERNNIFILTGPTACGKTSLVYQCADAASASKEFRRGFHVIEIHAGMKRSGQALKKAIEEATQSQGGLIAAQKSNKNNKMKKNNKKKRRAVDKNKAKATTALILIDEIENVFLNDGDGESDHGFWSSLNQLSKRSKCPIVLTCNSNCLPSNINKLIPPGYEYGELTLPSPKECADILTFVAKKEEKSLEVRDPSQLTKIAEYLHCDVRRMLSELQLWVISTKAKVNANPEILSSNEVELIEDTEKCENLFKTPGSPLLKSIHPTVVSSTKHTDITLKGNFNLPPSTTSLQVEVLIGSKKVPSKVISKSKIIATVPPFQLLYPNYANSNNNNSNIIFANSSKECISCRYHLVRVQYVQKPTGIVIREDDSIISSSNDGRKYEFANLLEYSFPQSASEFSVDSSDEEELQKEESSEHVETTKIEVLEGNEVKKETDETNNPIAKNETGRNHSKNNCEMKEMEKMCTLLSDAAILEDYFTTCAVPIMNGPVRGLGTHSLGLESSSSKSNNVKPPSFDKLFSSGWNENSMFYGCSNTLATYPSSMRDRHLLSSHATTKQSYEDTFCSKEDDEMMDEEIFVTNPIHNNKLYDDLASYIRHEATQISEKLNNNDKDEILRDNLISMQALDFKRSNKRSHVFPEVVELLSDAPSTYSFTYGLGLTATFDKNPSYLMSKRMVLDYLPYLRLMTSFQSVLTQIHKQKKKKEQEEKKNSLNCCSLQTLKSSTTPTRRSTRTSKKNTKERENYFDAFLINCANNVDRENYSEDICEKLGIHVIGRSGLESRFSHFLGSKLLPNVDID